MKFILHLQLIFVLINKTKPNHFMSKVISQEENKKVLKQILTRNFGNYKTLTFIGDENEDLIVPDSLKNPVNILVLNKKLITNRKDKDFLCVVFYKDLNFTLENITNLSSWNSRAIYIVVKNQKGNFKNIFETLWKHNLLYTAVIFLNSTKSKIYKATPFNGNMCGKYQNFSSVKYHEKINFTTPKNLSGCEIKAFVMSKLLLFMPYVNDANATEQGIFQKNLKFICDSLNLKINFQDAGLKLEKKMQRNKKDFQKINDDILLIILLRLQRFYELYDLTDIYFFDDYNWIVRKSSKLPNFKVLLSVFSSKLWILLAVTFLCCLFIYCILTNVNSFEKFFEINLILLRYVFGTSINIFFRGTSMKMFIIFYLFYSMNISILFQSKLSSMMTNPGYERGISSFEEMADSNLIPILYSFYRNAYEKLNYSYTRKIYDKSVAVSETFEERLQKVIDGRYTTVVYKHSVLYRPDYLKKIKFIGSDFLMNMEACFNLKKDSPFLDSFNFYIRKIHESGFNHKWMNDIIWMKFIRDGKETKVLTLEHVEGAFKILYVGISFGLVCFVIENLSYFFLNSSKIIKNASRK